jgi:hypothetical protein
MMKARFKLLILGLIAISVLASVIACCIFYMILFHPASHARAKSHELIYDIDHAEILAACRFVRENLGRFRPDPKWSRPDAAYPDPEDPLMPAIIRRLKPTTIEVQEDSVRLEFGGGPYHYGLTAFTGATAGSGTKEIIPGLWYFSEDGVIPAP